MAELTAQSMVAALAALPRWAIFALGLGAGLWAGRSAAARPAGPGADDGEDGEDGYDSDEGFPGMPAAYQMTLVVNKGLKMSKGKIGAQCGHATLGSYRVARREAPKDVAGWLTYGQKKICCQVDDDAQLLDLVKACERAGVPHYLVIDAGHTQIPAGSRTVLGIGPVPVDTAKAITGTLRLL